MKIFKEPIHLDDNCIQVGNIRFSQERDNDIKRIAKALEEIVKLLKEHKEYSEDQK